MALGTYAPRQAATASTYGALCDIDMPYIGMQPSSAATTYGSGHVMPVGKQDAWTEPSAWPMMLSMSQDPAELTRDTP